MIRQFGVNRAVTIVIAWLVAAGWALTRVLDVPHAILLAAIATALVVVWPRELPDVARLEPLPFRTHAGARSDLSHLSWMVLDRDGAVSPRAVARVRALTDGRPSLDRLRSSIDATSQPTVVQVSQWLDIIEGAS